MNDEETRAIHAGWNEGRLHRFNLAILGGTGVGKSTLVNAVFGKTLAATGIGRPVTQGINYYYDEKTAFGLYDFQGVESYAALNDFINNFKKIYLERISEDQSSAIHGVWYCIKASDRRFDEQQEAAIRRLAGIPVPVTLVVTQTMWHPDRGIAPDTQQFLSYIQSLALPIVTGRPVPVCAIGDPFIGTRSFGLTELLAVTRDAAPEGVRAALAAAQRIDPHMKRQQALVAVGTAVAASAGIAAVPIPVADAPALVAVQTAMMSKIAKIYNVDLSATAVATALAGIAAVAAGRTLVAALLKFVPGAGTVINSSVAGTITGVLGQGWTELCDRHVKGEIDLVNLAGEGSLADTLLQVLKSKTWVGKQAAPASGAKSK